MRVNAAVFYDLSLLNLLFPSRKNLEIGLPVDRLRQPIRACLSGEDGSLAIEMDAVNRRGKSFRCKVTCTPLRNHSSSKVDGVILQMEEVET